MLESFLSSDVLKFLDSGGKAATAQAPPARSSVTPSPVPVTPVTAPTAYQPQVGFTFSAGFNFVI